jgi:hypothetical protein
MHTGAAVDVRRILAGHQANTHRHGSFRNRSIND